MLSNTIKLVTFLLLMTAVLQAQEEEKTKPRPIRNTFESIWLMDNQTVDVPFTKTFEWDIQHRFGTWNNGYDDYFGLAAPSNIRLGFVYIPVDKLQIGFGITKERKIWDFSAKYVFFKQTMDNSTPVSLAYYGVAGIDSRNLDSFVEASDRFSYFNQIMLARKFSDRVSLQVAPSFSYFNTQEEIFSPTGEALGFMDNTHFAISAMGRLGLTESMGLIVSSDFNITEHAFDSSPKNNLAISIWITTSSHAFQLFVGNYQSLNPQYNSILNQNSFGDNQILIGFNITRLWNF